MAACPRCKGVELEAGKGSVGEDVCPRCAGRFLPPEITERVVVDELGVEREILREIAALFSGLKLPCAGCRGLMSPLRLRGVHVDLCLSCGGLWLDSGELKALTSGRHSEVGAPNVDVVVVPVVVPVVAPVPVVTGIATTSLVVLGRGKAVIALDRLEPPSHESLSRAFARTDGLTDVDAQLLSRHCQGIVAEGLSIEGARALQTILGKEGIGCSVVDDAVLRLPAAIHCSDFDVDARGIVARLHTGAPFSIPWSEVGAVVGGVVHRERLEPKKESPQNPLFRATNVRGNEMRRSELEHELVGSDDVIVDVLQISRTSRRLRLVPSPRKELANAPRGLCDAAVAAGVPVGRGPRSAEWPRYRRLRELERECSWVAWRAARWPAA
ncbi:MAG: zf-TFIIB domain-containing protein [Deltaproteobacteria bacterium]|nr:zf-TFIIB domain-containing protein [Deltaproteobacteria bacterium]